MTSRRLLLVVGARPNFMKMAPIIRLLDNRGDLASTLLHTGQHYDHGMSAQFFDELGIRAPDINLGVRSGTHAEQTAQAMVGIERVLLSIPHDLVVVAGDVNSTLAAALAAAKLGVRVAHVEAGLRSGDWSMPEEVNRVLTDRLSDLCLTPSREADVNLRREGIPEDRIRFVGNVMIDTLFAKLEAARQLPLPEGLRKGEYAVATIHRPSNVDREDRLREIAAALETIGREIPMVFPIHPRTTAALERFGVRLDAVRALPPLGYVAMLSLQASAGLMLTDSGGIQEETSILGVPCLTLRSTSERPLTISRGTNRLVPDRSREAICEAFRRTWGTANRPAEIEGWDGAAGERIVDALLSRH